MNCLRVLLFLLVSSTVGAVVPKTEGEKSNSKQKAGAAETWSMITPLMKRDSPYKARRSAGAGSFQLTARMALREAGGTGASILLGDELMFGLDGKYLERIFVEGSALDGHLLLLDKASDHIESGKLFDLKIERNSKGITTFSIGEKVVYKNANLAKKPLSFTFRPHRATLDILSVELRGDLLPRSPDLKVYSPVVPVLLGAGNTIANITLNLEMPRKLDEFVISGNTENMVMLDENGEALEFKPDTPRSLPPGEHRFRLEKELSPDADLNARIDSNLDAIVFADGKKWLAEGGDRTEKRPAIPIHRQGEHDCHTTRIPAMARTRKGTLLGVYDLRYNSSRDLQEHIDIGLSRSTDGGQTWEPPRPVMDMGDYGGKPQKENGVSDPNILVDPETGRIFVSAVWTYGKPNTHQWRGKGSEPGFEIGVTAQFMVVTSDDDGVTWSAPRNWTRALKKEEWWLFAPAPGNGIALDDGTLVMPTQGRDKTGLPFSNLMWSRDHGQTWTLGSHARSNTTECAVAELSDGALLLSMRDNRNRSDKGATNGRALGVTRDLGKTWETHPGDHGALPEPVCMASLISHRLPDGRHMLLFSNPNDKHARRNITIQASFDDGKTWPKRVLLDEGTGRGYSSLVMVDEETIGILYESSRADLVFQKIPLRELL